MERVSARSVAYVFFKTKGPRNKRPRGKYPATTTCRNAERCRQEELGTFLQVVGWAFRGSDLKLFLCYLRSVGLMAGKSLQSARSLARGRVTQNKSNQLCHVPDARQQYRPTFRGAFFVVSNTSLYRSSLLPNPVIQLLSAHLAIGGRMLEE